MPSTGGTPILQPQFLLAVYLVFQETHLIFEEVIREVNKITKLTISTPKSLFCLETNNQLKIQFLKIPFIIAPTNRRAKNTFNNKHEETNK